MIHRTAASIFLAALTFAALFTACGGHDTAPPGKTLVIYHHGSPTPAIEAAQKEFERLHPDVTVRREKGDALPNMRKVTDQGKRADIVYTDDYSIIPPVMFPKFANAWIRYAHDEMTIAYAANSKYASEITPANWYEILARPDVKFGIADPNAGPDGYFSIGQVVLSDAHYGRSDIFQKLLGANTAITVRETNGQLVVDCPEDLRPNANKLVIRPDPESLYPMILAGEIDYAFGYMGSVVGEGPAGILTVDLPPQIDLSDLSLVGSNYNQVAIDLFGDRPDRRIHVLLGAKANGLVIPSNAPNPDLAAEYLTIFLGKIGQDALRTVHITPIVPAETNDLTKVPVSLRPLLRQVQ